MIVLKMGDKKKKEYILIGKNNSLKDEKTLINLLNLNPKIKNIIDNEINFNNKKLKYKIKQEKINEEIIYFFTVISDDNEYLDLIQEFDVILRKTFKNKDISIYVIWDDVSKYYCTESYPIIYNIENKMRKIVNILMIRNFGSNWVSENIPFYDRKNKKNKEIENFLYDKDFIELKDIMFEKYPFDNNLQSLVDIIQKEKITQEIIERYKERSNWERVFSKYIKIEDLEKKWGEVYKFRNKVAHNKNINRQEYENAMKNSNEIEKALDECLKTIEFINISSDVREKLIKINKMIKEKNKILSLELNSMLDPNYINYYNKILNTTGLSSLEVNSMIDPNYINYYNKILNTTGLSSLDLGLKNILNINYEINDLKEIKKNKKKDGDKEDKKTT